MNKALFFFVFLSLINFTLLKPSCKEGTDNCIRCNPLTNLCDKCSSEIYIPNENGGCSFLKKCEEGKNFCLSCNENEDEDWEENKAICEKCETGFYPDESGRCSFTENCQISYKGICLKCNSDFILIGENNGIKICKSLLSSDLINCNIINNSTGLCDICKDGFYLNSGDKKCINIENCYESTFGKCNSCNKGYYLNVKEGTCKNQEGSLLFCKISLDGKSCDVCEEDYFFDENGKCIGVNYCSEGIYYCQKCIDGYFMTGDGNACTQEKNCYSGDKLNGLCNYCKDKYYIDLNDRKCKSNLEKEDFYYCKKVENNICILCENEYNLSEDGKCTSTKNCAEVEKGKCISCSDGYYLGLDNRCTNVEHCIYSETFYQCKECEDDYYLNTTSNQCLKYIEGFENCKLTTFNGNETYCYYCKNGFYMNQTNHLCYNNKDEDNEFYKCLLTDLNGKYCISCEQNYFAGYIDHKCSKIYGCDMSENEDRCLECDDNHCLDTKTGKCEYNYLIEEEKQKIYYRCKKTNKEGTACEVCLDEFELSEKGFCVDMTHCVEKEDGKCIKCQNNRQYSSCLNNDFGCVPTSYMKCIECNNFLDFDICTKCRSDHTLNEEGICIDNDLYEYEHELEQNQ